MSSVEFHILPLVQPTGEGNKINLEGIKEVSSHSLDGYPREDRAIAWLAMLNVYPQNPSLWESEKKKLKKEYWDLVPDFLNNWHNTHIPNQMSAEQFIPYHIEKNTLMSIIHGDVVRTGRTIFFFPPQPIPNATPAPEDETIFQFGVHCRRLERILYTFASNHTGLGYMQGFNELLPPFYYVLLSAISVCNEDIDLVEALSFHCFQALLVETNIMDLYNTSDNSSTIMHKLNEFVELMKKHIPQEYEIITKLGLHPLLYCYRWFNLMFSQEHDLPDLLGIWDGILSHFDDLVPYIYYLGLGHVHAVKNKLKPGNYGETVSALQNLEIPTIKEVIEFANECWDADHKKPSLLNISLQNITNFFSKK